MICEQCQISTSRRQRLEARIGRPAAASEASAFMLVVEHGVRGLHCLALPSRLRFVGQCLGFAASCDVL